MIMVKEEFLASPKTQRAIELGGFEVLAMWLALKGYAAANPTDGFIPDEELKRLPGAPKGVTKAMASLRECGKLNRDGTRGAGLVEQVTHGWQLHDYLDHATSSDEVRSRTEKERRRKALQRALKRFEDFGISFGEARRRFPGDTDATEATALYEAMSRGETTWDAAWDTAGQSRGTDNGTRGGTDSGTSHVPPASAPTHVRPCVPAQPSPAQPSHLDPEIDSPPRTRARGERPRPRPVLLATRLFARDYLPLAAHGEYAAELGLTPERFEDAVRDLRDKYGSKLHDEPWLDDKLCAFIEQEAKPKPVPAARGRLAPVQSSPAGYDPFAEGEAVTRREELARKEASGA